MLRLGKENSRKLARLALALVLLSFVLLLPVQTAFSQDDDLPTGETPETAENPVFAPPVVIQEAPQDAGFPAGYLGLGISIGLAILYTVDKIRDAWIKSGGSIKGTATLLANENWIDVNKELERAHAGLSKEHADELFQMNKRVLDASELATTLLSEALGVFKSLREIYNAIVPDVVDGDGNPVEFTSELTVTTEQTVSPPAAASAVTTPSIGT